MSGIWMAKEIGAFERNGLTAELVHISSGATSIQALVGGSVQAALGASNAVVAATVKGAPIIAVASNTSRPGMQLWVQPEIQRAEQLQGKTLAITRFGSTSDFVTRLVLRKLNLEGKIELRQFGGVVEADIGFRARQAEGRVSSQAPGPPGEDARRCGGARHSVFDESVGREQRLFAKIAEVGGGHRQSLYRRNRRAQDEKSSGAQAAREIYGPARRQLGAALRVCQQDIWTLCRASIPPRWTPCLEMVGSKGAPKTKLFDNAIVDRLAQEGFIDKLYKGAKP